jgi:nucleotide-binding universal stress UspA family protein
MPYEKILVPLDGSPLAEAVLPHVQALAQKLGSEIVLFQAVPTFAETLRVVSPGADDSEAAIQVSLDLARQQKEAEHASAKAYLQRTSEGLAAAGARVTTLVKEGPAALAILEAAAQTGSDLIAISTHGRTGLRRVVLGSVTDEVLRTSGRPILVIRPQERA